MSKRPSNASIIFSGVLIIIFAVAIILALGYHHRAKVAPLVVSIPGIVVVLVLFIKELRAKVQQNSSAHSEVGEADEGHKSAASAKDKAGSSEMNAFVWVVLLFVLLYFLGFAVAIPLYLFLYMKVKSAETLKFSLTFAAVSSVVLYVFFMQILKMQLYPGLIYDLVVG